MSNTFQGFHYPQPPQQVQMPSMQPQNINQQMDIPLCQTHQQQIQYLCIRQNKPLCFQCVQQIKILDYNGSSNNNNIVAIQKGLFIIESQMQQQLQGFQEFLEINKTPLSFPDNAIQLYLSKNQEFEESYSSMKQILQYYKNLSITERVNDMELYLQNFNTFLSKANQAQIILVEIHKSNNSYINMFQDLTPPYLQAVVDTNIIVPPKPQIVEMRAENEMQNNNMNVDLETQQQNQQNNLQRNNEMMGQQKQMQTSQQQQQQLNTFDNPSDQQNNVQMTNNQVQVNGNEINNQQNNNNWQQAEQSEVEQNKNNIEIIDANNCIQEQVIEENINHQLPAPIEDNVAPDIQQQQLPMQSYQGNEQQQIMMNQMYYQEQQQNPQQQQSIEQHIQPIQPQNNFNNQNQNQMRNNNIYPPNGQQNQQQYVNYQQMQHMQYPQQQINGMPMGQQNMGQQMQMNGNLAPAQFINNQQQFGQMVNNGDINQGMQVNQMQHQQNHQNYECQEQGDDSKRAYRKKKNWGLVLKINIETPDLDNKLSECFQIEIGSNQRLKVLQQTILDSMKNIELKNYIQKQKMYIYIAGKEPVSRKSKNLMEMGVKCGDELVVTTEMKLPMDQLSDDSDENNGHQIPPLQQAINNAEQQNSQINVTQMKSQEKSGILTPPNAPVNVNNISRLQQSSHSANASPTNIEQQNQNKAHNQQITEQIESKIKEHEEKAKQPVFTKKSEINKQQKKTEKPKGEEAKKASATKAAAAKKFREVQIVKIFAIQQHYKESDFINQPDQSDEEIENNEKEGDEVKEVAENKSEKSEQEKEIIEEEQLAIEEPEVQEDEPIWEEEHHQSIGEENVDGAMTPNNDLSLDPYDHDDTRGLQVNMRSRASGIRKVILEQINLFRKANILLFKKNPLTDYSKDPKQWKEFSKNDYDLNVKQFQGQTIAYRVYQEITVCVDGKGQSFKCNFKVDPKDNFEKSMQKKTHFWRQFVSGGKCIVIITNKNNDEEIPVPPEMYNQEFLQLGVCDKAVITLYDISRFKNDDMGEYDEEEGEDEMEEGEDEEIEELVGNAEDLQQFENSPEKVDPIQQSQPNPIETQQAEIKIETIEEPTKKASEVLFEHEAEKKNEN